MLPGRLQLWNFNAIFWGFFEQFIAETFVVVRFIFRKHLKQQQQNSYLQLPQPLCHLLFFSPEQKHSHRKHYCSWQIIRLTKTSWWNKSWQTIFQRSKLFPFPDLKVEANGWREGRSERDNNESWVHGYPIFHNEIHRLDYANNKWSPTTRAKPKSSHNGKDEPHIIHADPLFSAPSRCFTAEPRGPLNFVKYINASFMLNYQFCTPMANGAWWTMNRSCAVFCVALSLRCVMETRKTHSKKLKSSFLAELK